MAYVSGAVYDAAVSIDGGHKPWGPKVKSPAGASSSAAGVEAAHDVLAHYFPAPCAAGVPDLDAAYTESLAAIADAPAAGLWRLTPRAYLPPQTPWVASMKTYVLRSASEFLPPPPPALSSTACRAAERDEERKQSNGHRR
jgi:hypothetical protein